MLVGGLGVSLTAFLAGNADVYGNWSRRFGKKQGQDYIPIVNLNLSSNIQRECM